MRAEERDVGGIRCSEVLAFLADYLDGDLLKADRCRVEAHLAACDWCERFGGEYAASVSAIRKSFDDSDSNAEARRLRLLARLRGA